MEKIFTFDHESPKTNQALGISDELDRKCIDIIFFSTVSNHFIKEDLFGNNKEDVPRSLNTMSGDLEKAMSLCATDKELYYVLFNFKTTHDLALEIVAKHEMLNNAPDKDRVKIKLLMQLMDLKVSDAVEENEIEHIRALPSHFFRRIELIENNKYDFNKYLSLVEADDLLGKALGSNE